MNTKEKLLGKTKEEITKLVKELGMPTFTAQQIAQWVYVKRIQQIDEMTNISKKNREKLAKQYQIGVQPPIHVSNSTDGTKKYLFQVGNHHFVESVYIPEKERATLCLSIQIGCKMNCLFCMTGKQGFKGQLTTNEVINQIYAIPESQQLTNIVFMGMGEPLDNLDTVMKSIEIITGAYALGWSPKRITLSTIGVIPSLKIFLKNSSAHLAISLHSPFAEERQQLIPLEKRYPIAQTLEEIKKYDFSHQRRISFEYIMFDGLNDTQRHATQLVKMLRDIDCRMNLIRFHAIPDIPLSSSSDQKIATFAQYLNENGLRTTIRQSRGEDIEAACGMLSATQKA